MALHLHMHLHLRMHWHMHLLLHLHMSTRYHHLLAGEMIGWLELLTSPITTLADRCLFLLSSPYCF